MLLFYLPQLVRTDTLVKTAQGNVSTPVLVVTIEMVYAITDVYPDGWATFVLKVQIFRLFNVLLIQVSP